MRSERVLARPGYRSRAVALAAVMLGLLGACAPTASPGNEYGPWDRRVALARLVVDNRTDRTLAVSFRYALRPRASVQVGRVDPHTVAELAPVPAQEPIILTARGEGFDRSLEPQSLEIDSVWTWVIADSMSHEP